MALIKESKSQEKFIWDIRVALAKNYTDNLSDEVRKGFREKVEQKLYPSEPKLSYISEGRGRDRKILFDPEVATPEQRRSLLMCVFDELLLMEGEMSYKINKGFQEIRNRVTRTNKLLKSSEIHFSTQKRIENSEP